LHTSELALDPSDGKVSHPSIRTSSAKVSTLVVADEERDEIAARDDLLIERCLCWQGTFNVCGI